MPLVAPTYLYHDQTDVEAVLSEMGLSLSLDDDQNGVPTAQEIFYLNNRIIPWSASRVNLYLMGRYDDVDLANSYTVNDFASTISARRARTRRGNPCPKSLQEMYEEVIELMEKIKAEQLDIEEVPERVSGAIAWSNTHLARYRLRRVRVQTQISEQTPRVRPANTDLPANYFGSENYPQS